MEVMMIKITTQDVHEGIKKRPVHDDWTTATIGPRRQLGHGDDWATATFEPRRQLGHCDDWARATIGPRLNLGDP